MGKEEQIAYWVNTVKVDLQAADLLISNRKILHGLFFFYLNIEKVIKAHIVSFASEIPQNHITCCFYYPKRGLSLSE
jgi:hypothetical protein